MTSQGGIRAHLSRKLLLGVLLGILVILCGVLFNLLVTPDRWTVQNVTPAFKLKLPAVANKAKGRPCYRLYAKLPAAGRLGNMMFSYASGYGIAQDSNRTLVIWHHRKLLLQTFNLSAKVIYQEPRKWYVQNEQGLYASKYDPSLVRAARNVPDHIQIEGYLQSWRYFHKYRDHIKKEFTFPEALQEEVQMFLHKSLHDVTNMTQLDDPVFIGVHIRRGDMTWDEQHNMGYVEASEVYLRRALIFFLLLFSPRRTLFVVASDEVQWSKEHFGPMVSAVGGNVVFSDGESATFDLAMLASCNHSLITVGTFGWWGAYLAGGRTVYSKRFPIKNSFIYSLFDPKDYYPPGWEGL